MSKAEELAKHLLLTTEEMASQCSAPFTLWNEHSNAALTAAAMIRQQAARIAALEEALEPFSAASGPLFMANYNDGDVVYNPNLPYEGGLRPRLTFRDFRRARAVLAAKNGTSPAHERETETVSGETKAG